MLNSKSKIRVNTLKHVKKRQNQCRKIILNTDNIRNGF